MKLLRQDWLPQAQKLAVGMTVRVYHRHERRPNLIITNARGEYKAYCQACKVGDVVKKEHVLLTAVAQHSPRTLQRPTDLQVAQSSEWAEVVGAFLARKNMMYPYLPELWVSAGTKRVLLQDDAGKWHGRDLTETSTRKWLNYDEALFVGVPGPRTVVTEDLFSMYKMRFALRGTDWSVCCTLGADCTTAAALALSGVKILVWAYDADKAGDEGYSRASKRMRPWGAKQYRARPPEGLDPKDMYCADILSMMEKFQ